MYLQFVNIFKYLYRGVKIYIYIILHRQTWIASPVFFLFLFLLLKTIVCSQQTLNNSTISTLIYLYSELQLAFHNYRAKFRCHLQQKSPKGFKKTDLRRVYVQRIYVPNNDVPGWMQYSTVKVSSNHHLQRKTN